MCMQSLLSKLPKPKPIMNPKFAQVSHLYEGWPYRDYIGDPLQVKSGDRLVSLKL